MIPFMRSKSFRRRLKSVAMNAMHLLWDSDNIIQRSDFNNIQHRRTQTHMHMIELNVKKKNRRT